MSLINILILIVSALLLRFAFPGKLRRWALLVVSILAIFWLQPALPIRNMDFWFPLATLGLILLSWALTADSDQLKQKRNWLAVGLTLAVVLIISLTRFISFEGLITATRPPQIHQIIIALVVFISAAYLLTRYAKPTETALSLGILALLLIFLVLKTPILSLYSSMGLRRLMAQDPALAQSTDLGWLGFSYVAFRLIHTLIDRMMGRLKDIQLDEYLVYTIFFPAFIAGPLDRLQRFRKDLDSPTPLNAQEVVKAGKRLAIGLFRKFILADSLAIIAISASNTSQVNSAGWLWLMLFAYSLQLFFDFAGYTDIAIGAGLFLGFTLPENFNRPYRQPNLSLFWNNWHMTLTQWFRGYYFNPVTRSLRRDGKLSAPMIILFTQISTMLIIGLWHGVTRSYLVWGAWHGLGLFIHNRWSAFASPKVAALTQSKPWLGNLFQISGILFTFLFVSLGWIWFSMPTVGLGWQTFTRLFRLGG